MWFSKFKNKIVHYLIKKNGDVTLNYQQVQY